MQHTLEQYSCPFFASAEHLLPTHWMNTSVFGGFPSEGRSSTPFVGPAALQSRSNSSEETTSLLCAYANSSNGFKSIGLYPVATTIAPYFSSITSSFA